MNKDKIIFKNLILGSLFASISAAIGRSTFVFTRLIVDGSMEFEEVPAGYEGPLYAEISPRTFSILVRTGSRLNQLRLRRGQSFTSDKEMELLQEHVG